MVCAPVIAATAYFVAIILLHLYNRDWKRVPGHALFGVFATLLILFICQRGSETMAWVLFGAPFVLVGFSYLASVSYKPEPSDSKVVPIDTPCRCPCPCCFQSPCHCRRPCWKPKPRCPKCPDCPDGPTPKPEPKPKPVSYTHLTLPTKA